MKKGQNVVKAILQTEVADWKSVETKRIQDMRNSQTEQLLRR